MGRASSNAFSIHPSNIRGARSYQWQAAPWRRGACGFRVLIKLLWFATRRRAVLGATFLDSHDSFGHLNPEAGLSGDVRASG